MKTFKKVLAILLLMTVVMIPVASLAEGIDMLKLIMETPIVEDIELATGTSIYGEVDDETARGVLCMIMYGEEDLSILASGINASNQYEIVMYNNLTLVQMLYYSYVLSSGYSLVQELVPAGESYIIVVSYGEDMIFIDNETEANEFAETVVNAISTLAEN